jgi:hypothetical protein
MADNPPQNREQRRAARFGRHRTDVRDAHDPWPSSEPNPALGENAAAGSADQDQAGPTATATADATEPDAPTADHKDTQPGSKPKG